MRQRQVQFKFGNGADFDADCANHAGRHADGFANDLVFARLDQAECETSVIVRGDVELKAAQWTAKRNLCRGYRETRGIEYAPANSPERGVLCDRCIDRQYQAAQKEQENCDQKE
jgi:hypothetical protein